MELVLLTVSICCMVWGIYNYSEVQKLEFKSEKTFLEIARELEILKKRNTECEKIMKLSEDRAYLEPPNNEAKVASQCYFCDADIYEGDDYYLLNGFNCCEECLDVHFKFTAELPDYEAEIADL